MMTPTQVAQRANVHVNSIRNWSKEYADLLSPQARGENGPRLFSDEDVEVLCAIAALRKSGVPPGEIAQRVRDEQAPPVIDVTPQESPQKPTEALQAVQEAPLAIHVAHNALQARVEAVERHLETEVARLEQRLSERVNLLITGIVIGMFLMLVALAVALQLG